MDSIFQLDGASRATFLHNIVQSFSCTYICLWSYLPPPSNLLLFMDGFYNEAVNTNQASSSSGSSLSQRLFDEYTHSFFLIQNERVPGLALKNSIPFMELNELELQRLASSEAQLQFYQEARIKAAIFMGCNSGEIELGMSSGSQVNLEMELKSIFPQDFSRQVVSMRNLPLPINQNPPSSSSSSMRSVSLDSPEVSPNLYFNISKTTFEEQAPIRPDSTSTSTSISPIQQAMLSLNQIRNPPFPSPEIEEAAMTNAILAILSSSPSPSSSISSHQSPKNPLSKRPSAFKRYQPNLPLPSTSGRDRHKKQSILKRTIIFLRALSLMRSSDRTQEIRPTTAALHHMIKERKRREKLNDSFQTLRSLLPPETKKDKASVLSSSTEYLKSLKSQVIELTRKNQVLEAQILPKKEAKSEDIVSSNETLTVQVRNVAESTSAARIVDLEVILRGEFNMLDLVIRVLEFLRPLNNVTLVNVNADSRVVDSNHINLANFILRIEDEDWDESAFVEAVKRVVHDLTH